MIQCANFRISTLDKNYKKDRPLIKQLEKQIQDWQTKTGIEDLLIVSIIRNSHKEVGKLLGEKIETGHTAESAEVWYGEDY